MRKRLLAVIMAIAMAAPLTACGEYRGPDVKVKSTGEQTYIYYHNGYKPGAVEIVENDDGTYTICVTAQPPNAFTAP